MRITIPIPLTAVTLMGQVRPAYEPKVGYRLCTYCGEQAFGGTELTCNCDDDPGPTMIITNIEIAGKRQ